MLNKKALSATAGAGEKIYVEDVFSTYLYTGNGGTQTITNNLDLSGEGGLVWLKKRTAVSPDTYTTDNHYLFDSARSAYALISNDTTGQVDWSGLFTGLTSTGFGLNTSAHEINASNSLYTSWSFRKAEKFFDVVTYTGNGTTQAISHNLGSTPGVIIVKETSGARDWAVYHRSLGETARLFLNATNASTTSSSANCWGNNTTAVAPTSTNFTVGNFGIVNNSGSTYVAYLFAHDAGGFGDSGSESVIKCGSYSGTGAAGNFVDLGWEPQWILIKRSAGGTGDWRIIDNMRGLVTNTTNGDATLNANTSEAEFNDASVGNYPFAAANPTGFTLEATSSPSNASGSTYIYIAIRRGPMKTPEAGTEVFAPLLANTSAPTFRGSFPIDAIFDLQRLGGTHYVVDRLRGSTKLLGTTSTAAEATNANYTLDYQTSAFKYASDPTYEVGEAFRRAPGFFDVVCYTGTGVAGLAINHNLTVVPEMMIVKSRDQTGRNWGVYHSSQGNSKSASLNTTNGFINSGTDRWNSTTPTSTVFYVGDGGTTNTASGTYVAYLFATLAGVSKVGSYTGTGTTLQVNCGFTSGARFVLIKRTDDTGDWYVWDSARGIVAGNDPYLLLNSTAAEVTNTDYIDTYSSGFEISSTAPSAINASGGDFIYLAIA